MKYQIIEKATGRVMTDLAMNRFGDIVLIKQAQELDRERFTVKLTRSFRTSGLESKIVEDIGDYVKQQVDECFPGEMSVELRQLMAEIIFNTFHDGLTYGEELRWNRKREPNIITGSK